MLYQLHYFRVWQSRLICSFTLELWGLVTPGRLSVPNTSYLCTVFRCIPILPVHILWSFRMCWIVFEPRMGFEPTTPSWKWIEVTLIMTITCAKNGRQKYVFYVLYHWATSALFLSKEDLHQAMEDLVHYYKVLFEFHKALLIARL